MSLVPSLFQAIVRVDGDALVMHPGDKPYVVSPTGQVELASRGLTLEAVNGIVAQLLPPELQQALEEFGAVQYELPPAAEFPGEHFTLVAARGGDDIWMEIRRHRMSDDDRVPDEFFGPSTSPVEGTPAMPPALAVTTAATPQFVAAMPDGPRAEVIESNELDADLLLPDAQQLWPGQTQPGAPDDDAVELDDDDVDIDIDLDADEE